MKIRVTVQRIRLACNLRGNAIVRSSSENWKVQDNEPLDEKTNRALPSPLRKISPQINTDFHGLEFLPRVVINQPLELRLHTKVKQQSDLNLRSS
jgi:hypothetical protein